MDRPEGFRTIAELAQYVGVSKRTIQNWIATLKVPDASVVYGNGLKLWSPTDAHKVLIHRQKTLTSTRVAKRRITAT